MSDGHLSYSGGVWKLLAVVCFFGILAAIVSWYATAHDAQFTAWVEVMGLTILGTMVILAALLASAGVLALYVRVRTARIELLAAQRRAEIQTIVVGGDDQVYLADEGRRTWRALSHDPRVYGNGEWTEPTVTEAAAYLAWVQRRARLDPGNPMLLLEHGRPPDLLAELTEAERVLVVGSSGSGKTTLLQHLAASRRGQVVVIDPHDDCQTWPANCQVIGGGQDYNSIAAGLATLAAKVKERYALRYRGELAGQEAITLLLDEWREIVLNSGEAAGHIKTVLTSGRKILMGVIVGSHSERAAPLGLAGEYDLKDGLYIVRLKGDRLRGFSATIDKGSGEVAVSLPGPYRPGLPAGPAQQLQLAQPPIPDDERRVLEMHAAGQTITDIGAAVYGGGSKGGEQNRLVNEVLRRHGRQV